jgi:hypothetical protein
MRATGKPMIEPDAFKEAVFLFEGARISSEMHYGEFEALVNRAASVKANPDSTVRGIYVLIGSALAVRGMVCFELRVDHEGYADSDFAVPLRHLVRTAGPGPDLGCGAIHLACRSQCPLTSHAGSLWEPDRTGETSPLHLVQQTVWRNRLRIEIPADVPALPPSPAASPEARPQPANPRPRASALTDTPTVEPLVPPLPPIPAEREALEATLDEAFGQERRVRVQQLLEQHKRHIEQLTRKHRLELEQQQQIYLDQIRSTRDEMQRLKSALRHEQSRSQRLQQLLRGEV